MQVSAGSIRVLLRGSLLSPHSALPLCLPLTFLKLLQRGEKHFALGLVLLGSEDAACVPLLSQEEHLGLHGEELRSPQMVTRVEVADAVLTEGGISTDEEVMRLKCN